MSASREIATKNAQKAGRPFGSTTRVRIADHFTKEEIKEFFIDLKIRAKTDTKIALYLAEQLTGKAVQPVAGDDDVPITMKVINIIKNGSNDQSDTKTN